MESEQAFVDFEPRPALWLTDYDYPSRCVSRTCTSLGWTGIRRDDDLSDPNGAFDVFVAHRPHQAHGADDTLLAALPTVEDVVKIVARLDDNGDFERPHPDFDTLSIGSPTIWPYKIAGEQLGLDRWVWASPEQPFRGSVRSWHDAHDH